MVDRERALAASRAEVSRLAGQRVSEVTPSRRDFAMYVATQKEHLAVIARLARRSVAARPQWETAHLVAHARACDDAEVAALAVSTCDGGLSMAEIAAIAEATTAPILRDDLVVHPSQLHHARLYGVDAVVLPAAELDAVMLQELVATASSLHMAAVVEVTTAADLEAAAPLPHVILGLRCTRADGGADVERTLHLARQVSRQRTVVALSEITRAEECVALRGACDSVVVGEALHATNDVRAALRRLVHE